MLRKTNRKAAGILSMTGFGKAALKRSGVTLEAEMRAVNHRFFDCVLRLPAGYEQFEIELREHIGETLGRGRVELDVTRTLSDKQAGGFNFRAELCKKLWNEINACAKSVKVNCDQLAPSVWATLLSRREVLDFTQVSCDEASDRKLLWGVVTEAMDQVQAMRAKEGGKLVQDLEQRFEKIAELSEQILSLAGLQARNITERFRARLEKVASEIKLDDQRLAQEVALIVDRLDVTEELVRIKSHLAQVRAGFSNPPLGRRLEFLVQELGREFNTIGSKAQDAAIQGLVVDAKLELERVREQSQNLV